jgi:hypothetical protein
MRQKNRVAAARRVLHLIDCWETSVRVVFSLASGSDQAGDHREEGVVYASQRWGRTRTFVTVWD